MVTKHLEVSSFTTYTSTLQITFVDQLPNIVYDHQLITLPLIATLKIHCILVEAPALLLRVGSHVFLKLSRRASRIWTLRDILQPILPEFPTRSTTSFI